MLIWNKESGNVYSLGKAMIGRVLRTIADTMFTQSNRQLLLLVSLWRSHFSALLCHRQPPTVNTRPKVHRPHPYMQKLSFDNVNTVFLVLFQLTAVAITDIRLTNVVFSHRAASMVGNFLNNRVTTNVFVPLVCWQVN
jgi:hypothetical protein